jgi:hypothetical protein
MILIPIPFQWVTLIFKNDVTGDASSSSSVADGDGTSDPHPIRQRVKRRKRRKRLNTDSSTLDPERAALIEKVNHSLWPKFTFLHGRITGVLIPALK